MLLVLVTAGDQMTNVTSFLFVAWSGNVEVPQADPSLILGKYLPSLGNLWVFGDQSIKL